MKKRFYLRNVSRALVVIGGWIVGREVGRADEFGSGVNRFTMEFVSIGNVGNGDDVTGYGGVSYGYRMGVTEVAQEVVTKAVNLGATSVGGGAWSAGQPAANVSWFEAARLVNWLNVDRGHAPAYLFNSVNGQMELWSSAEAWQAGGENLYRHKDAYYFLPSDDEWYKAAFHQNNGVTADYWDYATGSDVAPVAVGSGVLANTAVYGGVGVAPALVGDAGGLSPYGMMGQGGNVFEWQETAFTGVNNGVNLFRNTRGGGWASPQTVLLSSTRFYNLPTFSADLQGFRVASVPEPGTSLLMGGVMMLWAGRRRRGEAEVKS